LLTQGEGVIKIGQLDLVVAVATVSQAPKGIEKVATATLQA